MSKKKKTETKKQRKQRIHRNDINKMFKYYYSKKVKTEQRMPETFEEAIFMGILK